ncbi:MAG: hypothetical protein QXM68_01260 [Candidatus Aenigmatarchaeota archaeon]|nr:hypothetical protein [Candidatus Aenigmarchaeota archaeon]
MVEYKTLKSEHMGFGKNNFIEIARKKVIADNGESEFISLSRGFITNNGEKRYKQSVTIPSSKEMVDFIKKKLDEMV